MFRKSVYTILCALCHIINASVINVATTVPPDVDEILKNTNVSDVSEILNKSRRIINGLESAANRPYMVYLQLPLNNPKYRDYRRWLCGGVIVHEEYILTSAACIEDAKNFYVISGTFKHGEDQTSANNLCIKNGAKKAIWKCVPRIGPIVTKSRSDDGILEKSRELLKLYSRMAKYYVFDGHENDNIRWMNNDIAVVKVEDEFDFERRVRGCDYVPKPICFNNMSATYENPGNSGIIAGWGSTLKYDDWVSSNRRNNMGPQNVLRETEVLIISKRKCKHRWGTRYANIIDNYMICTKDLVPDLTEICEEKYVDCTDIMYSGESEERKMRRVIDPKSLVLHSPYHNDSRRAPAPGGRSVSYSSGGFCENDHGGPLIADDHRNPLVIGVISACLVKERTNKCYGPFLYTSVYKNRVLLNCAIYKNKSPECTKMYRSSITHTETPMSWVDHPDGPAKNEIAAMRRAQEQGNVTLTTKGHSTGTSETNGTTATKHETEAPVKGANVTKGTNSTREDRVEQHEGLILRAGRP